MLWIRLKFSQTSRHIKVHVPNLVTTLNRTPIFELYVVWCGFKNIYQKDMCSKDTRPCAQNDNHSKLNNQLKLGDCI